MSIKIEKDGTEFVVGENMEVEFGGLKARSTREDFSGVFIKPQFNLKTPVSFTIRLTKWKKVTVGVLELKR